MARSEWSPMRMAANPLPTDTRLVWIDLEMTGLDPDADTIIEIATRTKTTIKRV